MQFLFCFSDRKHRACSAPLSPQEGVYRRSYTFVFWNIDCLMDVIGLFMLCCTVH